MEDLPPRKVVVIMKHCIEACRGKCGYATIDPPGFCGYKENMEEWMLCPILTNNWEAVIDKSYEELSMLKGVLGKYE